MGTTAGKPALLALFVSAALLGAGCDEGGDPMPDVDMGMDAPTVDTGTPQVSRADLERELLANLATEIIEPAIAEFVTVAGALESAVSAYEADPSESTLSAAQAAWRDAMDAWQPLELMQLGPTGMSGAEGAVGGEDIRDEIYTYERSSTCRMDQETVEGVFADPDDFAAELVNVRGLDALEYLLFGTSFENTCSSGSPINREGTWRELGDAGVTAARAEYAATVAVLIRREAERLQAAWSSSGGDFTADISNAGLDGSSYSSAQAAMNDLAGAMLYLDTDTRDMKLAEAAGISGCDEATCPDALETPRAGYGGAMLASNVRAFQLMYLGAAPGTDAPGWDDVLVLAGSEDLAADLATAIAEAIVAVDAVGTNLADAIESDPAAVMDAYDALSAVLRLWKTDTFTVLDIEPTGPRIGDND